MDGSWQLWTLPDGRLKVVFKGHLTEERGDAAAAKFESALAEGPRALVWDVTEMSGYDRTARLALQKALLAHRDNIQSLTIVGGDSYLNFAAKTIGLAVGIPVDIETMDEHELRRRLTTKT